MYTSAKCHLPENNNVSQKWYPNAHVGNCCSGYLRSSRVLRSRFPSAGWGLGFPEADNMYKETRRSETADYVQNFFSNHVPTTEVPIADNQFLVPYLLLKEKGSGQ